MPWQELQSDENDILWDRFFSQFEFQPNFYERTIPAIREPSPFETYALTKDLSETQIDTLNSIFASAFSVIAEPKRFIYALDWQHTSYKFVSGEPAEWLFRIVPDGDYYVFLADDWSFGTFGHPWQSSLCVFGQSLLNETSEQVHRMLPLLRSG